MNVLLIIPETRGTIARVSFNLYQALKKRKDLNVYVVSLNGKDDDSWGEIFVVPTSKIPILRYMINIFNRIFFLRRIKQRLEIQISISTLLGCNVWNVLSKRNDFTIGLFHACLGQSKSVGYLNYIRFYLAYKCICIHLDKLFAVSKSIQADVQKYIPHKKVELVYNIHNFQYIKSQSILPLEDEFEVDLFSNPVILYVGGLYYDVKAPDRLVEAFGKAKNYLPSNTQLVFIGQDYDNCIFQLKRIIKKLQLDNIVHFLGQKKNPYQYMSLCNMLVSPSRDEGLPGVLIESMSLEKKIVSTNSSSGIWEILECDEQYTSSLNSLFCSKYGIITPNNLNDEIFTVEQLALGIVTCYKTRFDRISEWDQNRFSEEQIIERFLDI